MKTSSFLINKIKYIAKTNILSSEFPLLYQYLIEAGCPPAPDGTASATMLFAICSGIKGDCQDDIDFVFSCIEPPLTMESSSVCHRDRIRWCWDCIDLINGI